MRALFVLAFIVGCKADEPTDSGSTGSLTAPGVSTNPTETARSDQDVSPVILQESEGATNITYAYNWLSEDGFTWPQEVLPATTTLKGQVWTVTASPSSGSETGPPGQATVSIVNGPPTVTAAEFSPSTPTVGQSLECQPVGADDPDGDNLTFSYAWERGGVSLTETTNTLAASQVLSGQTLTCYVTPNDGEEDGNTVSVSGAATNTAPTATGSTITPSLPTSSDDLTCAGSGGDDVDGNVVTFVTFRWSVNGSLATETSDTLPASALVRGDVVVCTALPFDGATNGTGVPSGSVTVLNSPPVISQLQLGPTTAFTEDTLVCTPTATDADNDSLSLTYTWQINGNTHAETSNFLAPGEAVYNDVVSCTATASDGTASDTRASNTVTIGNTAPTTTAPTLTPNMAFEATTLTCNPGAFADADGNSVTPIYRWTAAGSTVGGNTSTLTGANFNKNQAVQCHVTPNDGSLSGSEVSSAALTIQNTAPTAPSSMLFTPSSPRPGQGPLTCVPSGATDDDTDAIHYLFSWTLNGNTFTSTTTTTWPGDTVPTSYQSANDLFTCTATAHDGTTSGGSAVASVQVSASLSIALEAPAGCTVLTTSYPDAKALLEARGHSVRIVDGTAIDTLAEAQNYDVIVFPSWCADTGTDWSVFDAVMQEYVSGGGGVVASGWNIYGSSTMGVEMQLVMPTAYTGLSTEYLTGPQTVTPAAHPISGNLGEFSSVATYLPYGGGTKTGATTIAFVDATEVGAAWDYGLGRSSFVGVIYLGDYASYQNQGLLDGTNPEATEFFMRTIEWTGQLF